MTRVLWLIRNVTRVLWLIRNVTRVLWLIRNVTRVLWLIRNVTRVLKVNWSPKTNNFLEYSTGKKYHACLFMPPSSSACSPLGINITVVSSCCPARQLVPNQTSYPNRHGSGCRKPAAVHESLILTSWTDIWRGRRSLPSSDLLRLHKKDS